MAKSLAILSAIITPTVLILATGQLILTTSQRLSRTIERTRKISESFEEMAMKKELLELEVFKKEILFHLMIKYVRRSKLLQKTMSILYSALVIFVATSIVIGIMDFLNISFGGYIPIILTLSGACFVFYGALLLFRESRINLQAINDEMDFLTKLTKVQAKDLLDKDGKRWWELE
ncbi:MAG TPA: DUF2721 domain-containing protein [Cytophagaceae bacterium]